MRREPNIYQHLPHHPETGPTSRVEATRARRERGGQQSSRSRQAMGGLAVSSMLSLSASLSLVGDHVDREIEKGKAWVEGSHAEIHQVYSYDGDNTLADLHGTFVLTGLGTKNPTGTAEILQPHQETGDVFAVEYSNQDLDTADMARRVIDQAKMSGLLEVTLDGYSVGGPVALDIAAYIHTNESELRVNSVILNSSPIGEGSLTEVSQRGVDLMNRVLGIYPDFEYYEKGRAIVEVINRSDRYLTTSETQYQHRPSVLSLDQVRLGGTVYTIDYEKLDQEVRDVEYKMGSVDLASASLIKSQADFMTLTDYDVNIKTLSRPGADKVNTTPPLIIYTRARLPEDDAVVNVEVSEANLVASLERHDMSYLTLRGEVGHANPNERREEYYQMFERNINPRIKGRLAVSLAKYGLLGDSSRLARSD